MRIWIDSEDNDYYVYQGDTDVAERIAGPFGSYVEAESALNEINPDGDDSYETNR